LSSKGEWLIILGYENGEISVYSLEKEDFIGELEAHQSGIIMMDVVSTSSQSLFLSSVSEDKEVKVHDLLLKETLSSMPEHLSKVVSAKFLNFFNKKDLLSGIKGE
jgi:WD40 repeat protein